MNKKLEARVKKLKNLKAEALKQAAKTASEMAAGALSSIHAGADIGRQRSSLTAGVLNGYLRVTVLQIDPGKKGRLKVAPSVMLKMELVDRQVPREVLVGWGERLCHQGDTVSIVGPEVRIPFRIETVPK